MNNNNKNNKNNKMDNDNDKKKGNGGCGCLVFVLVIVCGGFTWMSNEVGLSAACWIFWVAVGLAIGLGFALTAICRKIGSNGSDDSDGNK